MLLVRTETGDQGTFGCLVVNGDLLLHTAELPWRNNQVNISCIPAGEYNVVPYHSHKFGSVFHVLDVPGRTWILIHCGNLAGDVSKGFRTHSEGCILIGKYKGHLGEQEAVMSSRAAMRLFKQQISEPFELEVIDGFNGHS